MASDKANDILTSLKQLGKGEVCVEFLHASAEYLVYFSATPGQSAMNCTVSKLEMMEAAQNFFTTEHAVWWLKERCLSMPRRREAIEHTRRLGL